MPATRCDATRLDRYLAGDCEAMEIIATEEHLDSCLACRQRMEREAAAPEFWESVPAKLDTRLDASYFTLQQSRASSPLSDFDIEGDGELRRWLEPTGDESLLGRMDQYAIQGIVGVGGMGVVLRAYDTAQQRVVAIKTLRQQLTGHGEARGRFWREAQIAACLRHPNVIPILKIGSWQDVPYIVMPLVEQGSLSDRMKLQPLTFAEVLRVGQQVAAGLAAAHRQGMVHRDVKPSNILLLGGLDQVVISDFGLARIIGDEGVTHSGTLLGTPQFMSPEQAIGEAVDTRSDLFSLGSLLYWMCTQRSPFEAETPLGTLAKIIHAEHPPLEPYRHDVPAWFVRLLERLLAKKPEQRRLSADQVAEILGEAAENRLLQTGRERTEMHPWLLDSRGSSRRLPLGVTWRWIVAAVLLCGAVAGAAGYWNGLPGRPQEAVAEKQTRAAQIAATVPAADAGAGDANRAAPSEKLAAGPGERQGALDELDRLNLLADLQDGLRLRYWLERLNGLPADQTPPAAVPFIESLASGPDADLRAVAESVLGKNPFEEADELEPANPFVLIDD